MDNNTKLEQITNFILEQNNNKFSIQAFLKKVILEEINFTDDNIVYLAERFSDRVDVEMFVFIEEVYREIKDSDILLSSNINIDEEIDEIIDKRIEIEKSYKKIYTNGQVSIFNDDIPKIIAIKHYIRNKKINGIIDENPLYSRIIIINDSVLMEELPKQIELSKQTDDFYFIHRNKKRHGSFFIIHKGKYMYIDSICNEYTLPKDNEILKNAFLGSQNISIQSKLGCRIYTGLGMIILDEYIKKYGIENLEELGKKVEFSKQELKKMEDITNSSFTKEELINELKFPEESKNEYLEKIETLNNIRKELKKEEITEEEKLQLKELEIKVINNIKNTIQNKINQEKENNEQYTSVTEQSLLKLLQLIDSKKESIDIDKDFEEIILLFNRVNLDINKVFSLTHLLFPLAQTMTLVNSYIDHNEKLKEADSRIEDIKEKVKVNHFVNDFREDIKLRFDKIEELSKRINEQRLQDMKFFETPIEELTKYKIETTKEKQQDTLKQEYPDFIYKNNNEYIIALLEAVMDSTEIFDKYCNKDKKVIINN